MVQERIKEYPSSNTSPLPLYFKFCISMSSQVPDGLNTQSFVCIINTHNILSFGFLVLFTSTILTFQLHNEIANNLLAGRGPCSLTDIFQVYSLPYMYM